MSGAPPRVSFKTPHTGYIALCKSVYVCLHMYINIYICIYIHTCMCIYICILEQLLWVVLKRPGLSSKASENLDWKFLKLHPQKSKVPEAPKLWNTSKPSHRLTIKQQTPLNPSPKPYKPQALSPKPWNHKQTNPKRPKPLVPKP